jgi:hypothetical protein
MKRTTLSLVEIVVALVIIATVFLGLLATFSSVRQYTQRANIRLTTINFTRQVLNDLYSTVRADTWAGFAPKDTIVATGAPGIDGRVYSAQYIGDPAPVSLSGTPSDFRQVTVTVTEPEIR